MFILLVLPSESLCIYILTFLELTFVPKMTDDCGMMTDKGNLRLEIPDERHEKAYTEMMNRWEVLGEKIAPHL